MVVHFRVTEVTERTRILSAMKDTSGNAVAHEQKYWCVVLDPGRIAMDFGSVPPDNIAVGDLAVLTFKKEKAPAESEGLE
jgi:hypothetical protein